MANWISLILASSILYLNFSLSYSKSQLIQLDEGNWERMLAGEWMVEFYAPWCPACKALQPLWEEFSSWSKDLGVSVAQIDVTSSPGLSGRFMVTALPTIFHVNNGEFRQYKGSRDKEAFMSFVEDQKWKNIEAIPGWKSPSSFQMSVVAHFFKLSQGLRVIHNKLMDEYGLPSWGSYIIFALVTILLGALLGLRRWRQSNGFGRMWEKPMLCVHDARHSRDKIWQAIQRFRETGLYRRRPGSDRQRVASTQEDHIISYAYDKVLVCFIDFIYPPKLSQRTVVTDDTKDETQYSGDEIVEEELVEETAQDGNNVRKRKARKAD